MAELVWVLVLDDPTLVLDLEGLVGSATEPWLGVHVSGITTPAALHYVQLNTRQQVKVYQEVVLGYQAGCYSSRLDWAMSDDGTAVPLTLAYKTDLMKQDGSNKALLQGYGAYGSKQWPTFNPADLALLDRGLVLAVAHVRGGGELGSAWHIFGKKFTKKNTFRDFLAAGRHLVTAGYTSRAGLAVWGRSAGGLTLAASLNMDPGFAAVGVLDVPFLDVLATMRDPSLPLTIKERREWGDPLNDEAAYRYIASYSPYNNIQPTATATYPALLLTASLHDTRVNYWEPAKYTAAMRHLKKQQQQQQQQQLRRGVDAVGGGAALVADRPLLLLTDMHAGHFAASAASSRLQERAVKVAFILQNLGCG